MPKFTKKSIPALFAFLTLLAYGLIIPWLGFYWDDWSFAWIAKFLGPAEFTPAFRPFRPFLGPIFFVTTSFLPPSPIVWQIFGLFTRFFSALAAWWALRQIWPECKFQTLSASLLFLVFPGYSQQWVALTHINQEWVSLIAYLFSFGLTASALRKPAKFKTHTVIALLLLFWGLFPTEYFVGLEPLRFLIIWFVMSAKIPNFWERVKRAIQLWLPYFLLWMTNALWLGFYYTKGGYDSYSVEASQTSGGVLAHLIQGIGEALYKAGWYAWVQALGHFAGTLGAPSTILGLALVIGTFFLVIFYLQKLPLPNALNGAKLWAGQAVILGVAGILLGRLPSWVADLPLKLLTTYDRLTISLMFGASLLVAGLLEFLIKNRKLRIALLSLIIALAVGQQFMSANDFRRDWTYQRNLAWQLSWRIPAMEPGTLLLTHQLPMASESDLNYTAALNWIYAPNFAPPDDMPYVILSTIKRLDGPSLPALEPDIPIHVPYRTVSFRGSTSDAIVIYAPTAGCLRVLDPVYANSETYNKESDYLTDAICLSDPSHILTEAPPPVVPASLFGAEPEHTWCYFYTKAELARQTGNWKEVASLGNEASQQGYTPVDAFEWLPFIEGYAYTGNPEIAKELSRNAIKKEPRLRKGLCILWERVNINSNEISVQETALRLKDELNCAP